MISKNLIYRKIQLMMAINFMSSKDLDGECVMLSKSDDTEITINDKADKVKEELFKSLFLDLKLDQKRQ